MTAIIMQVLVTRQVLVTMGYLYTVQKSELGPTCLQCAWITTLYFEFDLTLDLLASKYLMAGCML